MLPHPQASPLSGPPEVDQGSGLPSTSTTFGQSSQTSSTNSSTTLLYSSVGDDTITCDKSTERATGQGQPDLVVKPREEDHVHNDATNPGPRQCTSTRSSRPKCRKRESIEGLPSNRMKDSNCSITIPSKSDGLGHPSAENSVLAATFKGKFVLFGIMVDAPLAITTLLCLPTSAVIQSLSTSSRLLILSLMPCV